MKTKYVTKFKYKSCTKFKIQNYVFRAPDKLLAQRH